MGIKGELYMKKIVFLSLIYLFFIPSKPIIVAQTIYRSMPTDECIDYIKSHGLTTGDYSAELDIPSGYGLVYELSNGELVVIPSDLRQKYVGFIFTNKEVFYEMVNADYFPIDRKYLTFWELERDDLGRLPESIKNYVDFLKETIRINDDFLNYHYFKTTYDSIVNYLNQNGEAYLKDKIVLAYSLQVMKYLVDTKNGKWDLEKRYEIYNSYIYPGISLDDEYINVIALFYSSLKNEGKNFEMFSDFVGITP